MQLRPRAPLVLVFGGIAAVIASLSVHAVMLQGLHIPYPPHVGALSLSRLPDRVMRALGVVALFRLLPPRLQASPIRAAAWLTLLLLIVNEQLIRDPLMEVVNLSNLTLYPFLDVVPQYLTAIVVAICVVASRRVLASWLGCLIVSVCVGVFAYMIFGPLADAAWAPVQAWTATREGHQLYGLPYGWQILVPAYLTFIEAVVGAFLVAASVSDRLPARPKWAWLSLVGLIFALRGIFFSCFTEIPISGLAPITTILSVGQFALESLCLALLSASAWMLAVRPRVGRAEAAKML